MVAHYEINVIIHFLWILKCLYYSLFEYLLQFIMLESRGMYAWYDWVSFIDFKLLYLSSNIYFLASCSAIAQKSKFIHVLSVFAQSNISLAVVIIYARSVIRKLFFGNSRCISSKHHQFNVLRNSTHTNSVCSAASWLHTKFRA